MNHFLRGNNKQIDVILQQNEGIILIKYKYSDENNYSSAFNLEQLKKIDILFGGSPPLPIFDAYELLCRYFKENSILILEVSNSRIIIEIEKDIKPNMRFELKREQNTYNNNNKNKYIFENNGNIFNSSNINYNENYYENLNNNNYFDELIDTMISKDNENQEDMQNYGGVSIKNPIFLIIKLPIN